MFLSFSLFFFLILKLLTIGIHTLGASWTAVCPADRAPIFAYRPLLLLC